MPIAFRRMLAVAALCSGAAMPAAAQTTFRWAAQGDISALDPHSFAQELQISLLQNVYEGLVRRDRELRLEPGLATEWAPAGPTAWRFRLREGVRFQDGSPFTAEDVAFSFRRASGPSSGIASIVGGITAVKVVDPLTVELETPGPNPVLPQEITNWLIMSRGWAAQHGTEEAGNLRRETYATRHANGTGPFRVESWQAEQHTVLLVNPGWWDRREHNLDRVEFRPIRSDATRTAALLTGAVDLMFPIPPQDVARVAATPGVRVLQGPELRSIFFGFDTSRDELLYSDVRGSNPLRDARVRRAINLAIDRQAIRRTVMRGAATPIGTLAVPGVEGHFPDLDNIPFDPAAARTLLAEAGWPTGFSLGLDCPNDRYVNDEAICTAVAAMLSRVGIRIRLNLQPTATYFARLNQRDTSFFMVGWTPGTYDAHHTMRFIVHSRDPERRLGSWNFGGYSNPRVDDLIGRIGVEFDREARRGMMREVWTILREDGGFVPLHQQALAWGVRDGVELTQRADNYVNLRWVRMTR